MNEGRGGGSIALQVVALMLAALLPIAWLVGRRMAPAAQPVPVLMRTGGQPVVLQASPGGVAVRGPVLDLPPPGERGAQPLRLSFRLETPGQEASPPYRLRLRGPDGDDLWQGTWNGPDPVPEALELILPAEIVRPGRHALNAENARGVVRIFPFVVPQPDSQTPH